MLTVGCRNARSAIPPRHSVRYSKVMGIYDREYYRDDSPRGFSLDGPRSMVTNLIIVNVVIYVIDALFLDEGQLGRLLSVQPETLRQPWQWWRFLTYGFAHDYDPRHILFNMLGLFFFGRDVEAVYGRRKFLGMYLTAILLGSLIWSLTNLTMSEFAAMRLVGASGAVTAVIMLFVFHFPRRTVYLMMVLPVPAWVLGVLFILLNVLGLRAADSRVAYDVHLVGAAYAYTFYRTRWDLGQLFSDRWLRSLKNVRPRPKLRVHDPETRQRNLDEQADAVLDKLHRDGEASLTSRERRILEEYSRRMQQKHR